MGQENLRSNYIMKTPKPKSKVRDFLTKENWAQENFSSFNGRFCVVTAVESVYRPCPLRAKACYNLLKKELNVPTIDGVFRWNDAPERTFEDVHNLCVKLDI